MPDSQAHIEIEKSLNEVKLTPLTQQQSYYPSPVCWQDEILYFLLVDRFSDGHEYDGFATADGVSVTGPTEKRQTPAFQPDRDSGSAEAGTWFTAGCNWCGGKLAGLRDKLGYLKRMGVTAVWLSPIFKQVKDSSSYHGYGIQNFLDVDPHFGTRRELKDFVSAAHIHGIRVILDIILNHAGDVFTYKNNEPYYYHNGEQWPVEGFRKKDQDPGTLPFSPVDLDKRPNAWPNEAIWPLEFQSPKTWTRKGQIRKEMWDAFPEYLDGDFLALKDIDHGPAPRDPQIMWDLQRRIHEFRVGPALLWLAEVYKFWIAYADIDGYRIDTVKHMEPGAVRFFNNVIHEYAQSVGKHNFYLIGEVTGGRQHAVHVLNTTGLDAALGINDIPYKLKDLAMGKASPGHPDTDAQEGYFDLFRNSLLDHKHTHQWYGQHVVTMFDDHDQVNMQRKARFCGQSADAEKYLPIAIALNLTTAGIPCLYYGTEQAFNGADTREGDTVYSDVFLRECMFGGPFGARQSIGKHSFNENHKIYRLISEICNLRREHIALRRGRQYLRQVSGSGNEDDFYYPQPIGGNLHWVVAWSRLFADLEYVCAVNTDVSKALTVWVTVDAGYTPPGRTMICLLSTEPSQKGHEVTAMIRKGSAVRITVPAGGFVIYTHKTD